MPAHGIAPTGGLGAAQRQSERRSKTLLFCAAAIALAGAIYSARPFGPAGGETLVTSVVGRGELEEVVTATGKIQPLAYVDVGAQASGQLTHILVKIGDHATQGMLLAEIDPQLQSAKVAADEAQIAQYHANLVEQLAIVEYAKATLERNAKLLESKAVSKLAMDESRRDSQTAAAKADAIRAQIKQMQSTLESDRATLGYTRIFAPMSGTVVSIDAREGQTLNATYSTPQLLRIAELSTMTVWTEVSEADVTRLHAGMPVYFMTLGHGDRRWTARLRQILPAPHKPVGPQGVNDANGSKGNVANNVVLYTALFDVDNAAGDLRPEMTAQVFFVVAQTKDAVIAPVTALRASADGGTTVSVVDAEGRESERTVQVGLRTRFRVEITKGLAPGERVVTGRKAESGKAPLVSFHL